MKMFCVLLLIFCVCFVACEDSEVDQVDFAFANLETYQGEVVSWTDSSFTLKLVGGGTKTFTNLTDRQAATVKVVDYITVATSDGRVFILHKE